MGAGLAAGTVRRVDFGYFVRPGEETGNGQPRVEPCLGYLIGHPDGMVLLDTGMGAHPEVDAHYRPRRRDLTTALAGVPAPPAWLDRIMAFDPARVVFAHDHAVWEP
jgi:hypothetical protein